MTSQVSIGIYRTIALKITCIWKSFLTTFLKNVFYQTNANARCKKSNNTARIIMKTAVFSSTLES